MTVVRAAPGELLERQDELGAVRAALAEARAGTGAVMVIEGPAGIGKSRLLATARELAVAHGTTVLAAAATELDRQIPFGVAGDLFGARLRDLDGAAREELLAGTAAFAAALVDPATPAPEDPHALVLALHRLTANLAGAGRSPRPLLLALDDAHWADPPSLRFLAHLAARIAALPVALLATIRSGEPATAPALLEVLRERAGERILRPAPLSEAAVGRLVGGELPAAEPAFVRACAAVTDGNPFLTRELVRALRADRVAPTAAAVPAVHLLAAR